MRRLGRLRVGLHGRLEHLACRAIDGRAGAGGLAGHAVNPSMEAHVAPSMALMVPTTHPPRPAHSFKVVLVKPPSSARQGAPDSQCQSSNASSVAKLDTVDVPRSALGVIRATQPSNARHSSVHLTHRIIVEEKGATHGVALISWRSGTLGAESPAWATVWLQVLRPLGSLGPHAGFSLIRPNS